MNLFKSLATGAAVLSAASIANADVTFHITGSTAFRQATIVSIQNVLTGNSTDTSTARDNSTVTSSNNIEWIGSNGTLGNYVIKASFNGSGAGVQLVSGGLAIPFLNNNQTGVVASPTVATSTDIVVPDVAMSDAFQGTTGYVGSVQTYLPLGTNGGASGTKQAHTYQSLTDNQVAIVTFKPMASVGFPQGTATTVTDNGATCIASSYSLTPQNFGATFSNGSALLSFFTGNNSDEKSVVYAVGRNIDSGTRLTYLAETGYGVTVPVVQNKPSPTTGTITSLTPYPANTVNGIAIVAGNDGATSGGTVRGYLQQPVSTSLANGTGGNAYLVTVLGTADADAIATTSASTSGVELPYNGYYFNETALEEGQYTLWGYEHEYLKNGLASSNAAAASFAATLATTFKNATQTGDLAKAGLPLSAMQVSRTNDGGLVTSLNY